MKHSQHYFTNTRITLYALFLYMIPTAANPQLFGGMIKAQQNIMPPTITLGQNASYFVGSVYDDHYLPYTVPTGPATTDVINVGTGNPLVDVQGVITTTGVTIISIPASCTGSGTLPAYSATATIPAGMTQDGIARDLMLSWAAQAYTINTNYITATLKSVGGTLNAKKLDINAGMGSDYLGVLLGKILYPYNSVGITTNFAVRVIAGIPDRMYGLADNGGIVRHNFLYLPVKGEDGKIWLNNNLGAAYANVNDPSNFNPTKHATNYDDYLAFGSLFQWGRKPDGHELMIWTGPNAGTPVVTTYGPRSDAPLTSEFIKDNSNWRVEPDQNVNQALWKDEASVNNPCPSGWRVPTDLEIAAIMPDYNNAIWSTLRPTLAGVRANTGVYSNSPSANGVYWCFNTVNNAMKYIMLWSGWVSSTLEFTNTTGHSVRCIKN